MGKEAEWINQFSTTDRLSWAGYDIVEGGVADDRVIDAIEAFINGYATVETTLSLLIYHKPNFQICTLNQDIADKHLTFKSHKII